MFLFTRVKSKLSEFRVRVLSLIISFSLFGVGTIILVTINSEPQRDFGIIDYSHKAARITESQVLSELEFLDGIERAFREFVQARVPKRIQGELLTNEQMNFRVDLYLSSYKECILNFSSVETPSCTVHVTTLPAQLRWIQGLRASDEDVYKGRKSTSNFITSELARHPDRYNEIKCVIRDRPTYGVTAFIGLSFQSSGNVPKIMQAGTVNLLVFNHCTFDFGLGDSLMYRNIVDDLMLATGATSMKWARKESKRIGIQLAEWAIKKLFNYSELYRKAVAYEALRPMAEDIVIRRNQSLKASDRGYPFWEFEEDVRRLQDSARVLGYDSVFANSLLNEAEATNTTGTLLVSYSKPWEFSLQWALLNLALLSAVLLAKKRLNRLRPTLRRYLASILPICVAAVNLWAFNAKPRGYEFIEMIVPGLLFLVVQLIAGITRSEEETSLNNLGTS